MMKILIALLEKYAHDADIVAKIVDLLKNDQSYKEHHKFKNLVKERELFDCLLIKRYMIEYHEFMYEKERASTKIWYNLRTGLKHCNVRATSDGLYWKKGEILPAVINVPCGIYRWYNHDSMHRIEGPAGISHFIQSWFMYGTFHRAELDRDGNALPACISRRGEKYYYMGRRQARDIITNIIKESQNSQNA